MGTPASWLLLAHNPTCHFPEPLRSTLALYRLVFSHHTPQRRIQEGHGNSDPVPTRTVGLLASMAEILGSPSPDSGFLWGTLALAKSSRALRQVPGAHAHGASDPGSPQTPGTPASSRAAALSAACNLLTLGGIAALGNCFWKRGHRFNW